MRLSDISVTVLTKNSQKFLPQVLNSLKSFGEVVVYDTGSEDDTIPIAKKHENVTVYQGAFEGFGPTHNRASSLAKYDWILSIDSDEIASESMVQGIARTCLERGALYSFPRHNYYKGKWIKGCGWYPDRQTRLYHRKDTCFTDAQVHEALISEDLKHVKLDGPIIHYSYSSVSDFISKMQVYSDLFARQNVGKRNSSLSKALMHGWFAFFKSYFLKKGFSDGVEGFVISAYNGHTAYYKYLKLFEANQKQIDFF